MATRLGAQTNHHLYLAKLLLQDLQRKLQAGEMAETLLLDAWGQAVVWHLQDTFQALIAELAEKAKRDLDTVVQVLESDDVDAIDQLPAELRELQDLCRRGWLRDLLGASREQVQGAVQNIDPLALREVSQQHYGSEELSAWFVAFDALIDRFRETTIEY